MSVTRGAEFRSLKTPPSAGGRDLQRFPGSRVQSPKPGLHQLPRGRALRLHHAGVPQHQAPRVGPDGRGPGPRPQNNRAPVATRLAVRAPTPEALEVVVQFNRSPVSPNLHVQRRHSVHFSVTGSRAGSRTKTVLIPTTFTLFCRNPGEETEWSCPLRGPAAGDELVVWVLYTLQYLLYFKLLELHDI